MDLRIHMDIISYLELRAACAVDKEVDGGVDDHQEPGDSVGLVECQHCNSQHDEALPLGSGETLVD
jgi:hypothetical protein